MAEPTMLFIVEGESRDYRFVEAMARCFFRDGRHRIAVVSVPAAQNIYMLYNRLIQDDFETDIVEVLRETVPEARVKLEGISRNSISQTYLFFDFDPHQRNLPSNDENVLDVLARMLAVFDNETENGKLYISYPMVEALYDYRRGQCQAFSSCFVPLGEAGVYKMAAGNNNPNASMHLDFPQWEEAIEAFALRVRCLLGLEDAGFEAYRQFVTPKQVLEAQSSLLSNSGCIFVLSAFPEFLLDYFKLDFWNSRVRMTKFKFDDCPKILAR